MRTAGLHILPGVLGALAALAVYLRFNLAAWPREAEAGVAIGLGWLAFGLSRWAVNRLLREESRAERMLAEAGRTSDHSALRTARMVEEAQARLARMQDAGHDRREALRTALADCDSRFEGLFADMLSSSDTARRGEDVLRRTLPRLESAFVDYCAFAARGDGLVDTDDTRERLITALDSAGAAADRARKDIIQTSAEEADISLQVLESTLTHSR